MSATVAEFVIADPPDVWRAAGFSVDDDGVCRVGTLGLRLVGAQDGTGIVGWVLRAGPSSVGPAEIDGVPTTWTSLPRLTGSVHPNGVTHLDHAVLMTPDLDRTVAALAITGHEPRRERDADLNGVAIRQIFFRLDDVVLEVVGTPGAHGEGPATLWGLTFTVADIDASAAYLGERTGRVKDAVQPGRRITTLRHRDLGISVNTALISAQP